MSLSDATREFQRDYLRGVVQRNRGNIQLAAQELGCPTKTLYNRLSKLGLRVADVRAENPLIGHNDQGLPIFKVTAQRGAVEYRNSDILGSRLTFFCPKCYEQVVHAGVFGLVGAADGHQECLCAKNCYPEGYEIKEYRRENGVGIDINSPGLGGR